VSYKIFNKTYQPIKLVGCIVLKRNFIIIDKLTSQVKRLERKGLLFIKKMK